MGTGSYTCKDYREEMMMLGLQKRLHDKNLSDAERHAITKQIKEIKKKMGMD
ncbi:MAG: hypothetical protein J7K84_01765 [Deltaproteobacteria bacterium]|nr:hypothetical protein [Deltaproteobacteria bacterium]